ncbi:MAG: enzyme of heme biosynthesis [Rikenellaceae bacterium]
MKRIKLALIISLSAICAMVQAQSVDFNDPRYASWGADAAEREQNMMVNTFFRDAHTNKNFEEASTHFMTLVKNCPEASESIYARGVVVYRARVTRAKSLDEKKILVDSLMFVHDLRLKYFSDHEKRGRAYILDGKARDMYNFKRNDRAALREVFKEAIEANGDKVDPQFVLLYFQNLCEDYKMDEVMADEVIAEYERLSPYFDSLESEYTKYRDDFTSSFSTSGVATCENLESIYGPKIIADSENTELLGKCVRLMSRLKCNSEFYVSLVEKQYKLEPSSSAAMMLAAIYQNKGDYDNASKYLRDALEVEEDIEQRESLNSRIALIELAANNLSAAVAAARESISTPDDTKSDNGIAYFVLAQCYAASAASCSGFEGQAVYWLAYDTMAIAVANFSSDEADYKSVAQKTMSSYPSYFPSQEECFFNELKDGTSYTVKCGLGSGQSTTVRARK